MDQKKNTKQLPLYLAAKEYLLKQIRHMKPGRNQLEPENLLSAKLGMSRETIRKAMSTLIHEGVVTRWHGKGNFGHPRVSNLSMRMDLNSDFRAILNKAGFSVRTIRTEAFRSAPSADMLNRMGTEASDEVVVFDQYFYADDQLAIICTVELPGTLVEIIPESGEYSENIKEFFQKHCSTESSYTTAWLKAALNAPASAKFAIPETTPLLVWEEVYHNIYDNMIGYVKIFFHPEIMDLSLLLKF